MYLRNKIQCIFPRHIMQCINVEGTIRNVSQCVLGRYIRNHRAHFRNVSSTLRIFAMYLSSAFCDVSWEDTLQNALGRYIAKMRTVIIGWFTERDLQYKPWDPNAVIIGWFSERDDIG